MTLRHSKILILLLLVIFTIATIIIFVSHQNFDLHATIDTYKFSHFGSFLAGILSGGSILLLILTFFFTLNSNEINRIEGYYQTLNKEIADANFNDKRGVEAYLNYEMDTKVKNLILDNLNLVVTTFEIYIDRIVKNNLISQKTKNNYTTRFYLLFYSKVLWPLRDW